MSDERIPAGCVVVALLQCRPSAMGWLEDGNEFGSLLRTGSCVTHCSLL